LTALLVLEFGLLFVLPPVLGWAEDLALAGELGIIVSISAVVFFAWPNLLARSAMAVSFLLGVGAAAIQIEAPSPTIDVLGATSAMLALSVVSVVVIRIVFAGGSMTGHRVRGAVVLYLNICLFFAGCYRLIAELSPGAFGGLPERFAIARSLSGLVYFSLATITTVGYGDIVPVHPIARSLAGLEAVLGQLYPAIILARIVTLYSESNACRP
jgi:hypothetical protein